MNGFVIYSRNKADSTMLRDSLRTYLSFHAQEDWRVRQILKEEELTAVLQEGLEPVISCVDLTMEEGVSAAERTRASYADTLLVVMVTPQMSPACYIRPSVMPVGVLVKPLETLQIKEVFPELFRIVQNTHTQEVFSNKTFSVKSQGETHRIPYADILYFEARNKKLYLNTKNAEIEFYDTLEHLTERLPDAFLRCHKSFLVNRHLVERMSAAQNVLIMNNGNVEIPISRSWKAAIKEALG